MKALIVLIIFFANQLFSVCYRDQVAVYGGVFDLMRERHRTFELGIEYKFFPKWRTSIDWLYFRPLIGVTANAKQSTYLYSGINFDLIPFDCFVIAPGFSAGWYHRGHGKDLGFPLEFRSSIALSWQTQDQTRFGFCFYHISNAGLGHRNPGTESLVFICDIPIKSGFPF